MYELSVRKNTDHYNGREWFVVEELDSGEELVDVNTQIEAVYGMLELILEKPDKYMTNQSIKELLTEANAQQDWSSDHPVTPGHYAWREIGEKSPKSILAVVSVKEGSVLVKFEPSLTDPVPMKGQAKREWKKVSG